MRVAFCFVLILSPTRQLKNDNSNGGEASTDTHSHAHFLSGLLSINNGGTGATRDCSRIACKFAPVSCSRHPTFLFRTEGQGDMLLRNARLSAPPLDVLASISEVGASSLMQVSVPFVEATLQDEAPSRARPQECSSRSSDTLAHFYGAPGFRWSSQHANNTAELTGFVEALHFWLQQVPVPVRR